MKNLAIIKHKLLELHCGINVTKLILPDDLPKLFIYEATGIKDVDLDIPFHAFLYDEPNKIKDLHSYTTELIIQDMEKVVNKRTDIFKKKPKKASHQSKPCKSIINSKAINTGQPHDAYQPIDIAQMMNISVQTVRKKLRLHDIPKPYKWQDPQMIIEKLRK